jgi:hypothetical protein
MTTTDPMKTLDFLKEILKPAILYQVVNGPGFNRYGAAILNRWAGSQPEELRKLERKGGAFRILSMVLTQQQIEQEILERSEQLLAKGLTDHEILEMHEVEIRLFP